MAKYIIVCGGVISGTGKGVASASIALLLKLRGYKVNYIKFEPYLSSDAGVLSPIEHGECFLCDDGKETDLDLGTVERIAGINMSSQNICTSGTLYKELIVGQERGENLGKTLQIMPHVTDKIQDRLLNLGKTSEVIICEIGGTVGDMESAVFYEAVRQFEQKNDVMVAMVAPILWVPTIKEFKTKPLQNAVKQLYQYGINPKLLLCRVDREIPVKLLDKVSDTTGINRDAIFEARDVDSVYQVPVEFYNRHIDDYCVDMLRLKRSSCRIHKYKELIEKPINEEITIGICGKYSNHDEAYLSLKEALTHTSMFYGVKININWIRAQDVDSKNVKEALKDIDGLIVPGGFDKNGAEGKIQCIKYVRENKIPFLGICLGLQCAVIEFAKNVCGIPDANSQEFDKDTADPVVHYLVGQKDIAVKSASMRLGSYNCELIKGTIAHNAYSGSSNRWDNKNVISERHRHRLEVNPKYLEIFAKKGLNLSGFNPETKLVEIMELDQLKHPFFIGTQAHPEFKSRLSDAAPLFKGFVSAALENKKKLIKRSK